MTSPFGSLPVMSYSTTSLTRPSRESGWVISGGSLVKVTLNEHVAELFGGGQLFVVIRVMLPPDWQ